MDMRHNVQRSADSNSNLVDFGVGATTPLSNHYRFSGRRRMATFAHSFHSMAERPMSRFGLAVKSAAHGIRV